MDFNIVFEDVIVVDGKCRVARIISIPEEATSEEIKQNLPAGFSLAKDKHLMAYKDMRTPQAHGTIIALGSVGPYPYSGNPAFTTEGKIVSLGISEDKLKWGEGALFLLLRDEVIISEKEKIQDFLEKIGSRSYKESTVEAIIDKDDGIGGRTILISYGATRVNGCVKCTYSYVDPKGGALDGPFEGSIPIGDFKQIIF